MDINIEEPVLEKIIKQANFAGLEQNLKNGDLITLKVGEEICQFEFNREAAIKQHKAPHCAASEDETNDTNHYRFTNKQELTALLGLGETVSDRAYFRAVNDRTYLHNLLCSRGTPLLETLLNDTGDYFSDKQPINHKNTKVNRSPDKLLLRFAKSMIKWGKSGFAKVDEATYNRRLAACSTCNLLSSVPNQFLYKLVKNKHGHSGICASCGCIVSKKALIATDTCPEKHPGKPGINRWGEPLPQ